MGFFPNFLSIGEVLPVVKIAKLYIEKGGEAIFFSHGGKFEYLAKEIGCEIIQLQKFPWSELFKKNNIRKMTTEKMVFDIYKIVNIGDMAKEEVEFFKKNNIKAIVSSFNITTSISARVLKIPLFVLISGTSIPPYYKSGFVTFPENYENFLTKRLPESLKNKIIQWILMNNKLLFRSLVKDFDLVAKKYKIKRFRTLNDIILGDYNLVCDDINFLGIKPDNDFPLENFIGPITGGLVEKQYNNLDEDIKIHLNRSGRSILFMMGSMHYKHLYLKILETLNQTNYNIIAINTIISKEELPQLKDNILLKKFIKTPILVNKMVDLAIIHGGRGTVYNAAYSGKPVIGIPMTVEHQYNIDNIVRYKAGLRISKKFFTEQELLNAITTIFSNYDEFLSNAQDLSKKLSIKKGEEKAVERLIETIKYI